MENCKCELTGDGFGIVCKKHYSEYMKHPMGKYLITTETFAKKIWKKLKVKMTK